MTSKHSQAPDLVSQGVFDSVKTFSEFEQRVSALFDTNTKAQGDAFEIFVEAYLATQPILQCQETWLVGDIPVDVRESLNLPNDAKGIDGVYRSTLNNLIPYQVKFRSNRPALGFNEVAPFLGITEKATDRLLITNCDTIAIDVKNRTGIRSLRGVDFDQLIDEDFSVIENWLKQKLEKRQPLKPDPYQDEALKNIANHLENNDRSTVVMACGTGKTLVALWAVQQRKAKSILVLVPSLTLLQQTLEEWSIHNAWGKDFSYLCVCSDPSVNLKNDEIEIDHSDVPFKIDTDPEIVRRYLAQDNGKIKIVFSTYQSSQVVSQATKGEFDFDIAIFDEAHKTTGSAGGRFAFALKDENIRIKKRLFLTATPKHYDISKRDKDGEFKFVSMDDEEIYGKRAHTLTFGDAAEKGIICPYKVIITLIDKQQVDDFVLKNGITLVEGDFVKAKWVASQIAISSAIKHTNATKIITFHSRVKTAREFASDEVYGIKKFVDDFKVFHVHGKQKSNERKDAITKFRKASRSIITNAKCLTEGVDVPAVDMVAFVDPRHSKIDIAQAVGRAMRKPRGGDKKVGYIVVPIFAKDTSEQSVIDAIKSEDFDDIALILNSLLEQDEELLEIIRELKQATGQGDLFNPKRIKEKIEVIGSLIGLEELTKSIYVEAVDRLGESWDENFGKLLNLKAIGININLKREDLNYKHLARWLSHQIESYSKGSLNEIRFKKLNSIGIIWNRYEQSWMSNFELMKSIFQYGGNVNLAQRDSDLGRWQHNQRRLKLIGKISNDRIDLLNAVGMIWSPKELKWFESYEKLKSLRNKDPNFYLSKRYPTDTKLGNWFQNQTTLFNNGRMSADRIELFKEIGIIFSLKNYDIEKDYPSKSDEWDECQLFLNNLKELVKNGINANISSKSAAYKKIGNWLAKVRKLNKANRLSIELKVELESLGVDFNPNKDSWNYYYKKVSELKKMGSDINMPKRNFSDLAIGRWLTTQRSNKREGLLSNEQVNLLNEIGINWNPQIGGNRRKKKTI